MITLQQLLMSDSDLSGGTQTGKGTDGAQDFLSLLAGALSDATGKGKDAPLTLADLKAAGSKLSKVAQDAKGDTTLQAKIADLLSRQTALNGDETSPVTSLDTLVSGLVPLSKGDALKTLNAANTKDDGKSELSEEELAGLSALMAMLPHQQTTASRAAGSEGVSATSTLNSATLSNGAGQPSLNASAGSHDKAQSSTSYQNQVKNNEPALQGNAPATPAAAAAAEKQELASSSSSSSPTATLAPIMSSHATSQTAATVATAPVLSQPLGTHEWQQSLSQHITLFTKQGQQTAELRLHPEDLGQVQISLKLDDNQAQLQMVSAHSHVRAALEAALPVLKTSLAENGIQLAQSSVSSESFAGQQQSSSQQQHQASRSGNTGGFNEESDELLPVPAALQSAARGNSAVDIFA
ncbi:MULTISPECIES: flagellar hook length control protein FliK [Enterobacter cloacae complex]|uniref:Flagellar hook length control protein FliK n=1 Tax=Enterobacter asburiae TaxID=61645 RepID=A0AAQ0ETC2_ENTAS|nr:MULTISPECIES: flagellar hook length control protein FliK [Enterobacter cloacae complex]QBB05666.1 flagellar hook length control protein FliK [Enterobacter cloacae]MCE1340235.1 flagellar hook length control protein FliK [Enterobacter asburiae]MCO7415265.1 flagellar hook length control protein FliK [Enterobacter asburiae]OZP69733.1 flagellar hook-length control protein FliK [Enterobacter asburiae]QYD25302.1 flagellar hook length control protein FliK [Enterobacter asburiae]